MAMAKCHSKCHRCLQQSSLQRGDTETETVPHKQADRQPSSSSSRGRSVRRQGRGSGRATATDRARGGGNSNSHNSYDAFYSATRLAKRLTVKQNAIMPTSANSTVTYISVLMYTYIGKNPPYLSSNECCKAHKINVASILNSAFGKSRSLVRSQRKLTS